MPPLPHWPQLLLLVMASLHLVSSVSDFRFLVPYRNRGTWCGLYRVCTCLEADDQKDELLLVLLCVPQVDEVFRVRRYWLRSVWGSLITIWQYPFFRLGPLNCVELKTRHYAGDKTRRKLIRSQPASQPARQAPRQHLSPSRSFPLNHLHPPTRLPNPPTLSTHCPLPVASLWYLPIHGPPPTGVYILLPAPTFSWDKWSSGSIARLTGPPHEPPGSIPGGGTFSFYGV